MKKIRVCHDSELHEGFPKSVKILTREVAVFRNGLAILARESTCKHMGASLVKSGDWQGFEVTCQWHGWEYNMISGECRGKPDVKLKSYPIEVVDGVIYVLIEV